jgi:hypothetical protein
MDSTTSNSLEIQLLDFLEPGSLNSLPKNSWNILCLSGNEKPPKEHAQFAAQTKDTKAQIPVLLSPGILELYKDIQINAVIITSTSNSFPECSLSGVSSMIIHLPRITSRKDELLLAHCRFLDSLPIDKFSSLKSLILENISLTDTFLRRIGGLKIEEMHWNHTSLRDGRTSLPVGSFPLVKRFYGKYQGPFTRSSRDFPPLVEKVVIHCSFLSASSENDFMGFCLDFHESKSLQYL